MLPVFLTVGPIKIYTFGVFLVLAFFWSSFFLWKLVRLTAYNEELVFDGFFFSLFGALFFSRLFYVILNFKDFGFNLLKFVLINGYPGLSLYGAIFGGFLSVFLFFNSKKIKFIEIVDYFVPSLFLALSLGKIGAFLAGVEVGSKTNFFLSVRYLGFEGTRHLTPFYEGLFFFVAFLIAYKLIFYIRQEKLTQGFNGIFFFWFFSLTNLVFEKIKDKHLFFKGISLNGFISGFLFLTIGLYFVYYFKTVIKQSIFMIIYDINDLFRKTKKKIIKGKRKDS